MLEHVYNVACRRILWNGTFQNFSDHVFVVRNFWNKNSMRVIFCFHRQPMWKRSPKIWHVNKRDFLENKFLGSDQRIRQRCCDSDFNSVWARLTYCFSKHPLKLDFLDIYLTTFSKSVTSKIQNLWGSSFYSKCLKFNLDFKNAAKNWEKPFSFSGNCISICIVKLSR